MESTKTSVLSFVIGHEPHKCWVCIAGYAGYCLKNFCFLGSINLRLSGSRNLSLSTNIISKKEETFAIENRDLVCTPQFSKLITHNYRIHCVTDRWEILTEDEKKSDLILKVAADTFKHLSETPIIAYGFNFNFQRETKCKNISEIASKLMINLNIGFPGFSEKCWPKLHELNIIGQNRLAPRNRR